MQHGSPLPSSAAIKGRQTLMDEDIPPPFDLPAVALKKVSAALRWRPDHLGRRPDALGSSRAPATVQHLIAP
jgi:hypothetical protein